MPSCMVLLYFRELTVNDILDILEESDESSACDIVMFPPVEHPQADSDIDSEKSDDETECNPSHLPRRLLQSKGELILHSNKAIPTITENRQERDVCIMKRSEPATMEPRDNKRRRSRSTASFIQCNEKKSEEDEIVEVEESSTMDQNIDNKKTKATKITNKERVWTKDQGAVGSNIPSYIPIYHPNSADILKETLKTPLDYFFQMFPLELVDLIVEESNTYAIQKNLSTDVITKEGILGFIGILLLSGYNSLPNRRLYWSSIPDTHNQLVSDTMRRNTFDDIMRRVHLADNMKMTERDPYYKVRQLFDKVNKAFKVIDVPENLSVDETLIPYYGRHGTKQFIRGKPVRFGYKLWSMCTRPEEL